VRELAMMVRCKESNLSRTLKKLQAAGMQHHGCRQTPEIEKGFSGIAFPCQHLKQGTGKRHQENELG